MSVPSVSGTECTGINNCSFNLIPGLYEVPYLKHNNIITLITSEMKQDGLPKLHIVLNKEILQISHFYRCSTLSSSRGTTSIFQITTNYWNEN